MRALLYFLWYYDDYFKDYIQKKILNGYNFIKKARKNFSYPKKRINFAVDLVRRGRRSHARGEYAPRGIHNKSEKINVRNC